MVVVKNCLFKKKNSFLRIYRHIVGGEPIVLQFMAAPRDRTYHLAIMSFEYNSALSLGSLFD